MGNINLIITVTFSHSEYKKPYTYLFNKMENSLKLHIHTYNDNVAIDNVYTYQYYR